MECGGLPRMMSGCSRAGLTALEFSTGKTRCNQVKFRCDCNPDSESGLLGELNIED
jgi:hypothetical protein